MNQRDEIPVPRAAEPAARDDRRVVDLRPLLERRRREESIRAFREQRKRDNRAGCAWVLAAFTTVAAVWSAILVAAYRALIS